MRAIKITLRHLADQIKIRLVASKIEFNTQLEQVTFTFPSSFDVDSKVSLHVEFTGTLNDRMAGFYRSSYSDAHGNKKFMASTQFEATDARKAFPCWDEPALKATFDITLNVDSNLTALSNMNVVDEKTIQVNGKALKAVKFAKTPIMSTYLVAMVRFHHRRRNLYYDSDIVNRLLVNWNT